MRDQSIPPLWTGCGAISMRLTEIFVERISPRGCLLGNFSAELSDQSPLIRDRLAALFAAWTDDIAAAIRDAQDDGSISTALDAGDLAGFLLDAFEGALLRARVEKSPRAFERFMTTTFGQILV